MKSYLSPEFRRLYAALPKDVKRQAVAAYRLFKIDPFYASLQFKLMKKPSTWSVRIGRSYRAHGERDGDKITWYWIGTHEEYNGLF